MICKTSNALRGMLGVAALTVGLGVTVPAFASQPFVAQIQYFPYNFSPRGWTFCNGQLLPIAQYTAVFALVGTTFGGDGRTTLGVPDMRGRAPIHPGQGPGLSRYTWGQKSGVETVTLTTAQLPSHTHALVGTNSIGNTADPTNATLARDGRDQTYANTAPNVAMHADSILPAGGGQAHDNMPPYLGLNCNFALTGVFPSRS